MTGSVERHVTTSHPPRTAAETSLTQGASGSPVCDTPLIARSGRGLTADGTAQLQARSALFVLVPGRPARVRSARPAAALPTC
ncbi:hypothetical protein [Streptomyces sp. NPDC001508]|uniref:hypothetical protein n=1 Tax=Streptomyces sp. NPDC001508 TaxID=3154656 RepID=UPI003334491F